MGRAYVQIYDVASKRNNKLAQDITRALTESMKRQTEANEELVSRIFEILEERDEAHKRFFGQWAEAFTSVLFDYARQATYEAEKSATSGVTTSVNAGFPIAGYDELSVEEISGRLEALSEAQIKQVRDHEWRTKSRKSLMEHFDRKPKVIS